jgi:hypothetical protein
MSCEFKGSLNAYGGRAVMKFQNQRIRASRPPHSRRCSHRTKAGKLVQTSTDIVSPDGKTRTATVTGTDANGRPYTNVSVYDKQ